MEATRCLNAVKGARYLLAASSGNVQGVYKPGHVKLKPEVLRDCQDAVVDCPGLLIRSESPFAILLIDQQVRPNALVGFCWQVCRPARPPLRDLSIIP